jgi:hypothetical protein
MTRTWQEHSLFILRILLCTLYFVFSILSQKTKLWSFYSRLFLVSKIESLNGHGLESAARIQENCQCIKPSFLQHCMWNAGGGGGGGWMQEGTVLKGALFNKICVLYIAVYLIISRTLWTVLITEITALYRPCVTNSISKYCWDRLPYLNHLYTFSKDCVCLIMTFIIAQINGRFICTRF